MEKGSGGLEGKREFSKAELMRKRPWERKEILNAIPETEMADGRLQRKDYTGWTVREFFSHESDSGGPGPGWDSRWYELEKWGGDPLKSSETWPEDFHWRWVDVEDENELKRIDAIEDIDEQRRERDAFDDRRMQRFEEKTK